MRKIALLALVVLAMGSITLFSACQSAVGESSNMTPLKERSIYEFSLQSIDGKEVKLEQYRDKALLIVNVASQCGYTPQYEGLQKVYDKYKDRGFFVLGFPANNFGEQEPGTNEEIQTFCRTRYNVSFPVFAKISVKGADKHPLYRFLTEKATNPDLAGEISWNFNKILIDKNGKIVARFESSDKPEDEKVTAAIEKAL
ncbi:MAG: glutathione peroxidase [Acidobacteriota bacterium]